MSRPGSPDSNITQLLHALCSADAGAAGRLQDRLYGAIYEELKQVADALMKAERAGHTLEPNDVVLSRLTTLSERMAQVVELRVFGGSAA